MSNEVKNVLIGILITCFGIAWFYFVKLRTQKTGLKGGYYHTKAIAYGVLIMLYGLLVLLGIAKVI